MTAPRASRTAADQAEPRAVRTRERVLAAIRNAAVDQGLDGLTVADVCRRAEIHRVTFYGHWSSLAEAVADAFTALVDSLAAVSHSQIAESGTPQRLAEVYERALVAQLTELLDHRSVYVALFAATGGHSFELALREAMRERAQLAVDALVGAGLEVPGRDGPAATYLAAGVTASFARFVAGDDDDPERAARLIVAQLPWWWPSVSERS